MKKLMPVLLLFAAALPAAGWHSSATAQARSASGGSVARAERAAERAAVDLKQGMTLDEVRQLLGKPRRTALKGNGTPGLGTLNWTYTWNGGDASSSSERSLVIEFAAKAPDEWTVSGWGWSIY
jgi:hypothetical protein